MLTRWDSRGMCGSSCVAHTQTGFIRHQSSWGTFDSGAERPSLSNRLSTDHCSVPSGIRLNRLNAKNNGNQKGLMHEARRRGKTLSSVWDRGNHLRTHLTQQLPHSSFQNVGQDFWICFQMLRGEDVLWTFSSWLSNFKDGKSQQGVGLFAPRNRSSCISTFRLLFF